MSTLETEKKLPTLPILPDNILKHIFSKMPDIYKMPIAKKFYPSQKELEKMVISKLKKLKNFNYISEEFPEPILYSLTQEDLIKFILKLSNHLKINIVEKISDFISLSNDIGNIIDNDLYKDLHEDLHEDWYVDNLTENNIVNILFSISKYDADNLLNIIDYIIDKYPNEEVFVIDKLVEFGCITKQEVYELIMEEVHDNREQLIKILN